MDEIAPRAAADYEPTADEILEWIAALVEDDEMAGHGEILVVPVFANYLDPLRAAGYEFGEIRTLPDGWLSIPWKRVPREETDA